MRFASLGVVLAFAACSTNDPFSGSYDGTLTVSVTGGQTVATTTANIHPDSDNVELFSTGSSSVDVQGCYLQGMSHSGTAIQFACTTHSCVCGVNTTNLNVTTASGTLVGDLLTLAFSGEADNGVAFSASFMGTLDPGTR